MRDAYGYDFPPAGTRLDMLDEAAELLRSGAVTGVDLARAEGREGPYALETQTHPVIEELPAKASALKAALRKIQKPMQELSAMFRKKLANDTEGYLDTDTRKRLESVAAGLDRRSVMTIGAWINMLETLEAAVPNSDFVDWMEIERFQGRTLDVGLYRHWIDPMKPFAGSIKPHLHGMAVTSATLRDQEQDWEMTKRRTGANYLTSHPHLADFESPFDYPAQTKIFIVNDVRKDDLGQVAGAYRALFEASGGGGLGIFTAISRLRAVYDKICEPLEKSGIPLYAQHVDDMDAGTLVDIFREDINACLLGTDAVRDGVDVPGEALRLIVFDRVPWPRPTILHKARRDAFGKKEYDEMIARLKLKQAFGRLIRKKDDRGVFVMLDPMLPSRLQTAFPKGVEVVKCGLAETITALRAFMTDRRLGQLLDGGLDAGAEAAGVLVLGGHEGGAERDARAPRLGAVLALGQDARQLQLFAEDVGEFLHQHRTFAELGERFWVLRPRVFELRLVGDAVQGRYQLEQHADRLGHPVLLVEAGAAVDEHHLDSLVGNPVAHLGADAKQVVRAERPIGQLMARVGKGRDQIVTRAVIGSGAAVGDRQHGDLEGNKCVVFLSHRAAPCGYGPSTRQEEKGYERPAVRAQKRTQTGVTNLLKRVTAG